MSGPQAIWIVVDLGFGDSGKGTITDFLVRELADQTPGGEIVVLRANGGAQAGHNVVTPDGRHHTFSQLTAGSFVAAATGHLGPNFVLHPAGLAVEADILAGNGVPDPLARTTIDRRATVVSPFQQAAGRLREIARGDQRHGTCGIGIGEAVSDRLAGFPDTLVAGDLVDSPDRVHHLLHAQQRRKQAEVATFSDQLDPDAGGSAQALAAPELALLEDPEAVERVLASWAVLRGQLRVVEPGAAARRLRAAAAVVCEGAQGVLLDQNWGFHPHTTWSDCTPAAPLAVLAEAGLAPATTPTYRLGVVRAYATRHGAGPFPTHDPAHTAAHREPHNRNDGWQGAFRSGPLDLPLLRYALAACGGVDGLALTCLDRIAANRVDAAPLLALVDAYADATTAVVPSEDLVRRNASGKIAELVGGPPADLSHRQRLGQLLARLPLATSPHSTRQLHLADLDEALGHSIWLESWGPTAADKVWRAGRTVSRPC